MLIPDPANKTKLSEKNKEIYENYKTLKNMRYTDGGLEGVQGYSKINSTALTTYTKIENGFH